MKQKVSTKHHKFLALNALVASGLAAVLFVVPTNAASGINQEINFQGRLLNSQGAVVPDGYYNIEFKIYKDGDGQTAGDTTGTPAGSLEWTEDYLNSAGNGVQVKNGFLSVQLGSITPFGTSVDWNSSTLWLSMNIAGTNSSCATFATCSPDGEMLPMKRLSSNAYSLNSAMLGGLTSADYLQLAQGNVQTDSTSNSSIAINKTGSGNFLQLQDNGTDAFSVNQSGNISFGNNANHSISVATATAGAGDSLTISAGNAAVGSGLAGGDLILQGGAGDGTAESGSVIVKSNLTNSTTTFSVQDASSNPILSVDTTNSIVQVGSSTANANAALLVLNNYNSATDPASGYNGAMYYNTSMNLFRCYQNGAWVDCAKAGGGAGAGTYVNLQSSTPGTADPGSFNVSGTGIADILQGTSKILTPLLDAAAATALDIGTTNATAINLNQNTTIASGKTLTVNGDFAAKSGANDLLSTDTTNNLVQIGSATANANPTLFVLNSYNDPSDPASGYNGAMYYNTSTNSFRCFVDGAWSDCSGAHGNFVQLAAGSAQLDSSTASSIFINKTGASGNLLELQTNGTDSFGVSNSGDVTFGNNADHSVGVLGANTGNNGNSLTISAGNAGTGSGDLTGGSVTIQGGNGGGANGNGGNIYLYGGNPNGTGTKGLVVISTPTFLAAQDDPNCYTNGQLVTTSCTISQSSVDNYSTIKVGFNQNGQIATLPAPTDITPGRVIYIAAAHGSNDFTLKVNGGGVGNVVSMRQDTSATMVWNGENWGAAGASSSTDLQAAYDNTLQSAGGAELVVSHTDNTNGLTIRDSTVNPVNGPILSVQSNSAGTLFSINSNVTEYSSDSGAEEEGASSNTFPASTWGAIGSATVSRYTTVGDYIATGQASTQVTTTATVNDGVKNTLNTSLTAGQHYNVSFAARLVSGAFTDLYIYYSADGTSQSIPCTTSDEVISSVWTKVNCSFTAPSAGITTSNAILIGQTGATARTFYVDNLSVTISADYNYATDGGVHDSVNFGTNWPAVGGAITSRSNTIGNDASDSAAVTTTGVNQGISNKLSVAPLHDSLYRVTIYAASVSSFSGFTVRYTPDNGATTVPCVDYNTQTVAASTSQFTKITCYIKTASNTVSAPYVYFTQSDSSGRTFYLDTFSLTLATDKTPNVQVGGGQKGGPTTLFTLDSAASAPIASDNQQLLGSMYYDTSLGKIQCYEATGWGSCGSASNTIVTISPEYTNAVMHGTGIGTMSSDICSGTLQINDGSNGQPTICASNETFNFYKWTSPQATPQTYSIYVTYQLPDTFSNFLAAQTSLMGRTDSSNSTVQYTIYKDSSSGLSPCGETVAVSTNAVSSWQIGKASGAADPSTCSFAPDQSIVFKIDVIASQNADAYVGNLNFTFSNR